MSSNPSARTQPCSPAVVAINAKMAHLAQNLSITELNNNAVDALKEGNLPHAFCCIFQATSCTKKERQIAQSQRSTQQRQQHLRHAQQSVKQGQQHQQQRQVQQPQQQQPPVELPSIDPPSDKHSSTTTTTTTISDDTTAETSQVADVTDRQTSSSSSSSTCRFEWVDVLKHTESYRDVRKRWQETDAHRLRYRGHGIGTEFLCVRPIRIVDVDHDNDDNVPPSDCAWVIWYNAAMIYHLIADELGESVQRLLAESHRLLLLVTHCIDRDHLGGLSKLMNVSSSSSPWRTALLCAWHNHACLYYERAQLNEMKRMMRLLYRVIAKNWKTTTTSCDDDQDDRWVTKTNSSGRHLFRQMALHARILCGHRCAGVA